MPTTLVKMIISIFSFYNFGTESACKTDSQSEGDPLGGGGGINHCVSFEF